ncbi:NAD(P)-binding protein [Favolaschia claudopus]|uniref:NAD(P)-binding protein n=1 Tax=Favolaschia claudopus TaxID=2862362 RepID=A0AAW0E006_9AGAR
MSSYVVTGASRGIGLEFVRQLSADSKNSVFALVRNKQGATKLHELARANVVVLEADVTNAKALQLAAAEVAKATNNKLDYLINNAGKTNHPGFTLDNFPSPEALEHDLLDNFRTNTIGVVHSTNAFLPLLKNGSAKKVVCLNSALADLDLTVQVEAIGAASYSISKAALTMVVAKYAAQYKSMGFTFLCISPGLVATDMLPAGPETEAEMKMLTAAVARYVPDFKGPISPEVSVKMQLEVIERWTVEQSGAFVSHAGDRQWI